MTMDTTSDNGGLGLRDLSGVSEGSSLTVTKVILQDGGSERRKSIEMADQEVTAESDMHETPTVWI